MRAQWLNSVAGQTGQRGAGSSRSSTSNGGPWSRPAPVVRRSGCGSRWSTTLGRGAVWSRWPTSARAGVRGRRLDVRRSGDGDRRGPGDVGRARCARAADRRPGVAHHRTSSDSRRAGRSAVRVAAGARARRRRPPGARLDTRARPAARRVQGAPGAGRSRRWRRWPARISCGRWRWRSGPQWSTGPNSAIH